MLNRILIVLFFTFFVVVFGRGVYGFIFIIKPGYRVFYFFYFFILLYFNYLRLRGYISPLTTKFELILFLGIRGWLVGQRGKLQRKIYFFSHLTPSGAPSLLMFFLFIIEVLRLLIQPFTISIRLVANIFTGHVLLTLVLERIFFSLFFPLFLIFLERIVRIVQAIVFVLLLFFYRA